MVTFAKCQVSCLSTFSKDISYPKQVSHHSLSAQGSDQDLMVLLFEFSLFPISLCSRLLKWFQNGWRTMLKEVYPQLAMYLWEANLVAKISEKECQRFVNTTIITAPASSEH